MAAPVVGAGADDEPALCQRPLHQIHAAGPPQRHQHVNATRGRVLDGQEVQGAQIDMHMGVSGMPIRQGRHDQRA